jgi:hypothetical protein
VGKVASISFLSEQFKIYERRTKDGEADEEITPASSLSEETRDEESRDEQTTKLT